MNVGSRRRPRPPAARGLRSGRLTTKPPLAPTGTINAFLTICAFIRPRTSVRKSSGDRTTQAAAGDGAAAQMHALDARRVDEDLEARAWSGQRHPLGIELERGTAWVRRPHQAGSSWSAASRARPRGSCAGCGPRRGCRRRRSPPRSFAPRRPRPLRRLVAIGSKRARNSSASRRRDVGMGEQRLFHVALAECDAAGSARSPADRHVAPVEPRTTPAR